MAENIRAVPAWFKSAAVLGVLSSIVIIGVNLVIIITGEDLKAWWDLTYLRAVAYLLYFFLLFRFSDISWMKLMYALGLLAAFLRFALWFSYDEPFIIINLISLVLLAASITAWVKEKGVWKKAALFFALTFLLNYVNLLSMDFYTFFIYHALLQVPVALAFVYLAIDRGREK